MRAAVCDDSPKDREKIRGLIEEYSRQSGREIAVTEYASGSLLCEDIGETEEYGIVFLNVNTGQTDGLTAARLLKEHDPDICIILVSAYMGCALEGYRVKAARFLIKEDLERTMKECLDEIFEELEQKNQKVHFSFVEGELTLDVQRILYVETYRHKNQFHTPDASYSLYRKLDEIEEELAPYGFLRVHRSFLVNMRHVKRISGYRIVLAGGQEIPVPKPRYPGVKREYALYKETH